jgi:hypothetical protein
MSERNGTPVRFSHTARRRKNEYVLTDNSGKVIDFCLFRKLGTGMSTYLARRRESVNVISTLLGF